MPIFFGVKRASVPAVSSGGMSQNLERSTDWFGVTMVIEVMAVSLRSVPTYLSFQTIVISHLGRACVPQQRKWRQEVQ